MDFRAQLQALANKPMTVNVPAPEWSSVTGNETLTVKAMMPTEQLQYFKDLAAIEKSGGRSMGGLLATRIIVDEQGQRRLTDDDAALLESIPGSVLFRISAAFNSMMRVDLPAIEKKS